MMNNKTHLIRLIELFEKHGGYWCMDSSECGQNWEIGWSPFLSNGKGGLADKIFIKRVYDIKYYYNYAVEELERYGVFEEKI